MLFILIIFLYLTSVLVYFDYVKRGKEKPHSGISQHFFEDVWIISPSAHLRSSQSGLILESSQNSYISLAKKR